MKQGSFVPQGLIKRVISRLLFIATLTRKTKVIAAPATVIDVSQAPVYETSDVITHTARRRAQQLPRDSAVLNEVPGRHRELKRSKRCVLFLLVLFFAIGTPLLAPAAATSEGDTSSIAIIDEQLALIDADPVINAYLYARMREYNESEGIEAVKVVVITGHRWAHSRDVKTFYIVRNDTSHQIDIRDSYESNEGSVWTYYPHAGQTVYALNVLLDRQVTVQKLLHLAAISLVIEKEDVPDRAEIVEKSPWLSSYLAEKDKEFLENFEFNERHRVVVLMQQVLQRQTVDNRVAYNLLVPL